MTEFCALKAEAHAYLIEDGSEHKKTKKTKKCVIKRIFMFENYTDSLLNDKIILKSQVILQHIHREQMQLNSERVKC